MEVGNLTFEDVNLEERDLHMEVTGGFVIKARLGSLIALRERIKETFEKGLIFCEMSNQNLFQVHWHDLSEKKQKELRMKYGHGK